LKLNCVETSIGVFAKQSHGILHLDPLRQDPFFESNDFQPEPSCLMETNLRSVAIGCLFVAIGCLFL
jgi:hypothetical protein